MGELLRKSRGFIWQRRILCVLTVGARFSLVTKDAGVAGKDYEQIKEESRWNCLKDKKPVVCPQF
jgi:hypothetical protein